MCVHVCVCERVCRYEIYHSVPSASSRIKRAGGMTQLEFGSLRTIVAGRNSCLWKPLRPGTQEQAPPSSYLCRHEGLAGAYHRGRRTFALLTPQILMLVASGNTKESITNA